MNMTHFEEYTGGHKKGNLILAYSCALITGYMNVIFAQS